MSAIEELILGICGDEEEEEKRAPVRHIDFDDEEALDVALGSSSLIRMDES